MSRCTRVTSPLNWAIVTVAVNFERGFFFFAIAAPSSSFPYLYEYMRPGATPPPPLVILKRPFYIFF